MSGPIICIPSRHQSDPEGINPDFSGVYDSYLGAIQTAGGIPLIIPVNCGIEAADVLYAVSHGLMLMGGEDVDPKHYGEDPHPKLGKVAPARDAVELHLVRRAWNEQRPILAICRGVQLLNVARGGTLYQDIPDQFPSVVEHRDSKGRHTWNEMRHSIVVAEGSKMAAIVGPGELRTNSLHHQGIKRIGEGLSPCAHAPDGLIEAVEAIDGHFCIGVQGHPEAIWNGVEPRWAKVFRAFVEACAAPK